MDQPLTDNDFKIHNFNPQQTYANGGTILHVLMQRICSMRIAPTRFSTIVAGNITLLCKNGVDVDARDSNGNTAWHLLARSLECRDACEIHLQTKALIQVGANPDLVNGVLTPLEISSRRYGFEDDNAEMKTCYLAASEFTSESNYSYWERLNIVIQYPGIDYDPRNVTHIEYKNALFLLLARGRTILSREVSKLYNTFMVMKLCMNRLSSPTNPGERDNESGTTEPVLTKLAPLPNELFIIICQKLAYLSCIYKEGKLNDMKIASSRDGLSTPEPSLGCTADKLCLNWVPSSENAPLSLPTLTNTINR